MKRFRHNRPSILLSIVGLFIHAVAGGLGAASQVGSGLPLGQQLPGLGMQAPQAHKAKVELLADHSAIVPGQTIELAIAFEIEDGWHIYWRNRGEGGLEPTFKWALPEHFTIGPVRFPPPKRHIDELGDHTFILEGEPILLTTLTAPTDAAVGSTATIRLMADWLICKEVCIKESQELTLELPVVAEPGQMQQTHQDDFDYARQQLPLSTGEAKYLDAFSAVANVDKVAPGGTFQVAVVIDVQNQYHINAHEPLSESLIPTDVFPDAVEGLQIGRPRFPPPHVEETKGGKVAVYRGRTVVTLPVEADAVLEVEQFRISGVLTYQACNDVTEACFPATAVEWELTLPAAGPGEQAVAANQDVFAPTDDTVADDNSYSTVSADGSWLQRLQDRLESWGTMGILLMALIGGVILNLMPCVLPVISIKILSFVQQARESRLRIFTLGLSFAGGIFLSFLVLGVLIVTLGQQWGGLFQYPQVTIGLAAVVTAFALSLFGVFSLNPPQAVGKLGGKVETEGHLGAFGMGLLATMLGTACTAPFLSAVIAFAVKQTPAVGLLIFAFAGLGMACPYVVLAAKPAWVKIIPRPGPWMTTFEHLVGFALLATVVWLLNPLAAQLGTDGLLWTLVFLLFVALAAWLYGKVEFGASAGRKARYYVACLLLVGGGWWLCFHTPADEHERIVWVPYTRERAMEAVESGKTIFIDYTAEWCVNCKANENLVLETPEVRNTLKELNVVPFKADYTSYDPQIEADLKRFGRSGVPMYVIFPAGKPDAPILLDEILTRSAVIEGLRRAGPSKTSTRLSANAKRIIVWDQHLAGP